MKLLCSSVKLSYFPSPWVSLEDVACTHLAVGTCSPVLYFIFLCTYKDGVIQMYCQPLKANMIYNTSNTIITQ